MADERIRLLERRVLAGDAAALQDLERLQARHGLVLALLWVRLGPPAYRSCQTLKLHLATRTKVLVRHGSSTAVGVPEFRGVGSPCGIGAHRLQSAWYDLRSRRWVSPHSVHARGYAANPARGPEVHRIPEIEWSPDVPAGACQLCEATLSANRERCVKGNREVVARLKLDLEWVAVQEAE